MESFFETKDLAAGYGGRAVIEDISMQIGRGEIVTLIGPNGAGKSTILKSIIRQLHIMGGGVYICGEDVAPMGRRELSEKMSAVLTERSRPELMSCREVVSAGRYPYTGRMGILSAEDKKQVELCLRRLRLEGIADRPFAEISDGQRQRVLLAAALCQKTDIMVLDEPTSFLDVKHKLEILGFLRSTAKQDGLTVIMSLHEIDLAQKLSDKVICVKNGRVCRVGTPDEIFYGDTVKELYGIDSGSYNSLFGSLELERPAGEPEVFVICGCGTGIPVFRSLQRQGVPFAAGILFENDLDFALAGSLASETVGAKAFAPIEQAETERALELIKSCKRVLFAPFDPGCYSRDFERLLCAAEETGKLERV